MTPIRTLRAAVTAVAVVALLAVSAQPAHADPPAHLACAANFQLNFDPSLTLFPSPQSFDVLGQAGIVNCVPLSGQGQGLQSGTVTDATGTGTAELCVLVTTTGTGEFEWNTGEVSEFDFEVNLNLLEPEVSPGFSAALTSGPLAGTTVTAVPALVSLSGTCLTGVTSIQALFAALVFVG